ncbi:MAG TPA: TolC family protein [Bryobacteraceae bacterium]|nr:TolC family protein [Bryobacteraceae bacterium]
MKPVTVALIAVTQIALAQTQPTRLTLKEAEVLALKNHPHVLAAESEVASAGQQVREARSAYYPDLSADITGSQGNNLSRIGAGALSPSRLFNRFGQGIVLSQLVTDSGRTPNLVASSRLHAQASAQDYQRSRYDVLLAVNRSYFDFLHAQALVKVAGQTVDARQLLLDQVSALAKNQLKSQLDVSFTAVNVSEAKLLLIRAQDSVQTAAAELARALGSDQPASYQLIDEPLPPSPSQNAEELVAQALANRPELAGLRLSRESAYKFAAAEKDLSRPTVSLLAVAGFLPFINQTSPTAPIPKEYEGAAVNVEFPIFNGHLFSARREAAHQRALESDQMLRDEQERVVRDVRSAWASASTAYQRIDVTAQFLRQAALALNLAQGRYNLGLASIIELTQAQLNVTEAEVENLSAKYDYQIQYAALQYSVGLLR